MKEALVVHKDPWLKDPQLMIHIIDQYPASEWIVGFATPEDMADVIKEAVIEGKEDDGCPPIYDVIIFVGLDDVQLKSAQSSKAWDFTVRSDTEVIVYPVSYSSPDDCAKFTFDLWRYGSKEETRPVFATTT